MTNKLNNLDLLSSKEILRLIPYSQNHLRRLEAKGQFPKRIRIGANRVAWVESEIDSWIEDRVNARTEGVE
jgi:prophage regulatory protein